MGRSVTLPLADELSEIACVTYEHIESGQGGFGGRCVTDRRIALSTGSGHGQRGEGNSRLRALGC
jgi:hypothetical protein